MKALVSLESLKMTLLICFSLSAIS